MSPSSCGPSLKVKFYLSGGGAGRTGRPLWFFIFSFPFFSFFLSFFCFFFSVFQNLLPQRILSTRVSVTNPPLGLRRAVRGGVRGSIGRGDSDSIRTTRWEKRKKICYITTQATVKVLGTRSAALGPSKRDLL